MEFAQFRGNAIFIGTCISGDATFFRTRFANVSFKDATLNGMVQFSEAIFGQADFQGAQFGGKSSWQGSLFQGDAGFDGALFLGRTSFPTATFLAMVSFTSARFQEEAFFEGTVFAKTADYSTAIFQKGISFAGATIDKMRLLKAQISSQISLQNAEFNRLEARWPVLCNHLRYDGETYLSLARNYRNLVQALGRPGLDLLRLWGSTQIHRILERFFHPVVRISLLAGNGNCGGAAERI